MDRNNNINVFAGCVGQGLYKSTDGGLNWLNCNNPEMSHEGEVRALAVHPLEPNVLYAGTRQGCYRSIDNGDSWTHLKSGMENRSIWSLLILPDNPEIIFAGTGPGALFRSKDEGHSWECLNSGMPEKCSPPNKAFKMDTRVIILLADPDIKNRIWAGLEIGGLFRSDDLGETWKSCNKGFTNENPYTQGLDIHSLTILPEDNGRQKTLLAVEESGVCKSTDDGENWERLDFNHHLFPWHYVRGIKQRPDRPETLFLGNGTGPAINQTAWTSPDYGGAAWRSIDAGITWQKMEFPVEPNSLIYDFAVNSFDPDRIYAFSLFGQIYLSKDGGENWEKLTQQFPEIRHMSWTKT